MPRVLIITNPSTRGHLNPLIGIVQQLRKHGHPVAWLATTAQRAQELGNLGVEVLKTRSEHPMHWHRSLEEVFSDEEAYLEAFRTVLFRAVDVLLPEVREAIRSYRPDVVVVDCLTYVGIIAADLEKVPYVGIDMGVKSLTPPDLQFRYKTEMVKLHGERDALFARYGLRPRFGLMECISPHATLVFATQDYADPSVLNEPALHLVGPSLPWGERGDEPKTFPWDKLAKDRPIIYVSLGSIFWKLRPDVFPKVAEASRDLNVQLVVAAGGHAHSPAAVALQRDALVVEYAPQIHLLERSSVFVSHGGANSVMESLYRGVPLLVVPVEVDQPLHAHLVQKAGVGLGIDPDRLDVDNCRAALKALLDPEGSFARRARQVGENYRAQDGAIEGARRIIACAKSSAAKSAKA
jgi:MGT family glycosyltransferase